MAFDRGWSGRRGPRPTGLLLDQGSLAAHHLVWKVGSRYQLLTLCASHLIISQSVQAVLGARPVRWSDAQRQYR